MTDTLVRIEPEGPAAAGLAEWDPIDPAKIESGTPVQHGHIYDEAPAEGYSAGVWHCTEFVDLPGNYSVDEFMLVLEGRVVMGMPDGSDITVRPGEAFVIPRGLRCQWQMPEAVRKIFMIVEGQGAPEGANPSLSRIALPLSEVPAPADPAPAVAAEHLAFLNADGRMSVTVTDHAGASLAPAAHPAHRLVHVVQGAVRVSTPAGEEAYRAGDSFYLRAGTVAGWHIEPGTRLLESRYRPAP